MFGGIRIIESPFIKPVPKIQLSPSFKFCTPEFRADMNAWLLDRFGTKEVAYMFQTPFGPTMTMHPKQVVMLKNIARDL